MGERPVTDFERGRIAQAAIEAAKTGKVAPNGPVIERFDPIHLAAALEQEAERALLLGLVAGTPGKVEAFFDPRDAILLAQFLRRHGGK